MMTILNPRRAAAFGISIALFAWCGSEVAIAQNPADDNPAASEESTQPATDDRPQASSGGQDDPTVPSEQIQSQLPVPETAPATTRVVTTAQLPPLPDLKLKGLLLTDKSHGTALIMSGEQTLTVPLSREEQAAQIPTPARQFAVFRDALRQLDILSGVPLPQSSEAEPAHRWLDGFEINGILFTVETFSEKAVLLRAHPHDRFVLVR